jgi:aldehyde dehydrogenase (NAD+)
MIEIKNYIDGQWCDAVSGKTEKRRNPANYEETVGCFPSSDGADVKRAIEAAQNAFADWRRMPAPKRAIFLKKAIEIFLNNRYTFL